MSTPNITEPNFVQPTKEQAQAVFDANIDDFISFLKTFVPELKESTEYVNEQNFQALASAVAAAAGNLSESQRQTFAESGAFVSIADVPGYPLIPAIVEDIPPATDVALGTTDDKNYMTPVNTHLAINSRVSDDISDPDNADQLVMQSDILSEIASATALPPIGSVGTYIFARATTDKSYGDTIAGANLTPAGTRNGNDIDQVRDSAITLAGTWRLMGGNDDGQVDLMTLWQRIA